MRTPSLDTPHTSQIIILIIPKESGGPFLSRHRDWLDLAVKNDLKLLSVRSRIIDSEYVAGRSGYGVTVDRVIQEQHTTRTNDNVISSRTKPRSKVTVTDAEHSSGSGLKIANLKAIDFGQRCCFTQTVL